MPPMVDPEKVARGRKAGTPYPDIAHSWTYLKEIDQSPLPKGMENEQSFELVPKDTPIVFRTFMQHAGMEAIAVGFPQGIHAAFDATHCRWAMIWKGKFLDAEATWIDRFNPPAAPLGEAVKVLDLPAPEGAEFKGYKLDANGVPTFLYSVGDEVITDRLEPDSRGSFKWFVGPGGAVKQTIVTW